MEMEGFVVAMSMILALFLEVGLNTLVKAATNAGMSNPVFVFYSNIFALIFLLPTAFFYYRSRALPPISPSVIARIFLFASLCCASQILLYAGIGLSSPTLCSAMEDLVPAFTFLIAITSRMENLDLKLRSSQAKAIGTMVSITGALIVTLYKGLPITPLSLPPHNHLTGLLTSQQSNWLYGGFLLALGTLSLSSLIVVQASILKDFPSELMVITIGNMFVDILSVIVALFTERNPKAWILKPDIELATIVYSAIFFVSLRSVVCAWACRKKGPVYVAMYCPLGMVVAVLMGVTFLGDTLYLGSVIGGGTIAIGFYSVMWGLAQEEKKINENKKKNEISSCASSPLLQNKSMDV